MPNFNATNSPTQQPWHAYYCDNNKYQTDKDKNQFFLDKFLNKTQQRWVADVLGPVDDDKNQGRLTNYRKITQYFLRHLPDMAFNLSGGTGYLNYKPLLQMGRVKSADKKIDHNNAFRLHYIMEKGFILISKEAVMNAYITIEGVYGQKNPLLELINNPDRFSDRLLGYITVSQDGTIGIKNEKSEKIKGFEDILTKFNDKNISKHADRFNWYNNEPFIPRLMHAEEPGERIDEKDPEGEANGSILPTTNMNNLNTILYGPPGTGKTYELSAKAIKIIEGANNNESRDHINNRFSELQREGRIEFTTFHQNYAYEDFIEGLRAEYDAAHQAVVYRIEAGILKRIAYRALYAWLTGETSGFELTENQNGLVKSYILHGRLPDGFAGNRQIPNFVLIIDEINRGNVARIFGELITLVEDSKRARRPGEAGDGHQPLLATLPYTKEPFILPPNLFIIGTMNTADRSLIGLDAALRRRFFFEEMPPKPQELQNRDIPGVDLENFLTQLNERIVARDVKDHCIGHAYFMEVETLADLANVMRYKVIPQLQEYFHDSPGDLHQLLQFGNDSLNGSFVDQDGRTNEACLTVASSYQNFLAR